MWNVSNNDVSGKIRSGSCLASILPPYAIPRRNDNDQRIRLMMPHYTANLLNQYTAINEELPTYDFDGNMLTNNGWTYTWNIENRLTTAETATAKLEFLYDYIGRRTTKKIYTKTGTAWTLQTTQTFVYDGFKQIAELTDNAATMYTVWQPATSGDLDVPLWTKTGATVQTYILDGNKNVRQLKGAAGTVVASCDYDPFGNVTSTGTATPWQFSSEYRDKETGLIYYNYRYYDPQLGRWIKRDTLGEKGGYNLYAMVKNSPVSYGDKLGLTTLTNHLNITRTAIMTYINSNGLPESLSGVDIAAFLDTVFNGAMGPDLEYAEGLPIGIGSAGSKYIQEKIQEELKYYNDIVDYFTKDISEWADDVILGITPQFIIDLRNWWQDSSIIDDLIPTDSDIYRSHYGSTAWQHGMVGDDGNYIAELASEHESWGKLSGTGVLNTIRNETLARFKEFRKSGFCDGYPLGEALHYLQDTRTPSHTRMAGGEIKCFYYYRAQSPTLHTLGDAQIDVHHAMLLSYKMIRIAFGDGTQDQQLINDLYRGTPRVGGVGMYGKR